MTSFNEISAKLNLRRKLNFNLDVNENVFQEKKNLSLNFSSHILPTALQHKYLCTISPFKFCLTTLKEDEEKRKFKDPRQQFKIKKMTNHELLRTIDFTLKLLLQRLSMVILGHET